MTESDYRKMNEGVGGGVGEDFFTASIARLRIFQLMRHDLRLPQA
jgi:hypothetical protein